MLSPESINHKSGSAAYVMPSLQLGIKVDDGDVRLSDHPHIFVVGDAADAFGARKSGSAAWYQVSGSLHDFNGIFIHVFLQADHAVRNIVRLIEGRDSELESYIPPPAAIKVSLGLVSLFYHCVSSIFVLTSRSQEMFRLSDKRENLPGEGGLL